MENRDEEKLILAKLNDKIRFCKTKNKIVNTEFLNMYQENVIKKELERIKLRQYILTGGYSEAESKILIIYPEKLTEQIIQDKEKNIIKAIEIKLPNEQKGKYQHRDYLGTIMQFGLVRERIGDIIVYDNKAYVIVLQENAEYIKDSLLSTAKFKKSRIEIIDTEKMQIKAPEFEVFKITSSSFRLDSIVSEILKISRNEASKLIESEKVSINCRIEGRLSKQIAIGDILIIRGKGKFVISENLGTNKKEKVIIEIKKYK